MKTTTTKVSFFHSLHGRPFPAIDQEERVKIETSVAVWLRTQAFSRVHLNCANKNNQSFLRKDRGLVAHEHQNFRHASIAFCAQGDRKSPCLNLVAMGFTHVFSNAVVDGWAQYLPCKSFTIVFLGNTATFERAVCEWKDSPAHTANLVFCCKGQDINMAEYSPSGAESSANFADWTGADITHTNTVLDGVMEVVTRLNAEHLPVILSCASGGCVPGVEFCRMLEARGESVRGLIVDSGVPGLGGPLNVPVSIWAYRHRNEYWNGGRIVDVWKGLGFIVDFVYEYRHSGHASGLTKRSLSECIDWLEEHAIEGCPRSK